MAEAQDSRLKAIAVGSVCWLASVLIAGPSLNVVFNPGDGPGDYNRFRDTFSRQIEDPFFRPLDERWEGGFLASRILVPVVAKTLGLGSWEAVGLIWASGLLALVLVFAYLASRIGDRNALFLTLALSMTAFTQASHTYIGYPDAVSHLLVMAMIVWPSPLTWFSGVLLGMFNDERLVVSLPLALALVLHSKREVPLQLVRAAMPCAVAAAGALLIAWLVRHGIITGAIGGRPVEGPMYPKTLAFGEYGLAFYLWGLLFSFGLLWLVPLRSAWVLRMGSDAAARWYWSAVGAYTVLGVLACSFTGDFWRSLASLFPVFLLTAIFLDEFDAPAVRRWGPPLVIVMALLPKLEQMGPNVRWLRPLPVGIYEYRVGESILSVIRRRIESSN